MENPQAYAPPDSEKFPIRRLNTCPEAKGMITKKLTESFRYCAGKINAPVMTSTQFNYVTRNKRFHFVRMNLKRKYRGDFSFVE